MMKYIAICGAFLFLFLSLPNYVSAHSGGTDSNGGHYCWTNCEQYGLEYGEYHYHNGGTGNNSQSEYNAGYKKGYQIAFSHTSKCVDYEWWWEGTQSYGNGFEDGIAAGEVDGDMKCQNKLAAIEAVKRAKEEKERLKEQQRQQEIEKKEQERIYQIGYHDGYTLAKLDYPDRSQESYKAMYRKGYKDGLGLLSKEALDVGYEQAFSKLKVSIPVAYKGKKDGCIASDESLEINCKQASEQFKKGYKSNKTAKAIISKAERDGYFLLDKETPQKGQKIYEESYNFAKGTTIFIFYYILSISIGVLLIVLIVKLVKSKKITKKKK